MKFSANLGFLWKELALPDAIRAAADAGFGAVECHWPYDHPADRIRTALSDAGVPMLSLNTRPGNLQAGENGLAALPGRGAEARAAIDEAIDYAAQVSARHVHVMAGTATGPEAHRAFVENLTYAGARAGQHGIGILIEPINPYDAPGYFLKTTGQAAAIIESVGAPNLRLMFDCYHVQQVEGDLTRKLAALQPIIGHIQFASVPGRGVPDRGEVDFAHVFATISSLGYDIMPGAEYRPTAPTAEGLAWLERFSAI